VLEYGAIAQDNIPFVPVLLASQQVNFGAKKRVVCQRIESEGYEITIISITRGIP
jgi:hypothetical protein